MILFLSQASYAQQAANNPPLPQGIKTGIFSQTVIYNGDTGSVNYYVPPTYNPAKKYKLIVYIGVINASNLITSFVTSLHLDTIASSPYYLNAIIVNPVLPTSIAPPTDTNKVGLAMHNAMSTYNIDPNYVYINGLSWAGRYTIWYGLVNWKRFRAIYAVTPDFELFDFGAPDGPTYSYANGKYIPMIIRVGSDENSNLLTDGTDDAINYRTFEPRLYRRFVDSNAIVSFAPEYSRVHEMPQPEMQFMGFNMLDKLASSYANNDAGISAVSTPAEECTSSFSPLLTIQNKGVGTLVSAKINYQVDGGSLHSVTWSGNMLRLQKDTVRLPLQSLTAGSHTIKAYTTLPNGVTDAVPANDTITVSFNTITKGHSINFTEGFEENTFPPPGWTLAGDGYFNWLRTDSNAFGWTAIPKLIGSNLFGGHTKSASAIYFDNVVGDNTGKKYAIRTPQYDFSTVSGPSLSYDYAYYQSGVATDTLAIYYSKDCGLTWSLLSKTEGTNLNTTNSLTGTINGILYPNYQTNSLWKTNTIDLSTIPGITGQPEVMFSFENISGHASLLYLDNISISGTTGIPVQKQESVSLEVYPNPTNGVCSININSSGKDNYLLEVKNMLGQLLYSEKLTDFSGIYTQQLDLKRYGSSVYFVSLKTQSNETVRKIIVN